jgi:carbamoyltransferase
MLQQEKIVGWIQGRMEFGPRALGNRSILGDPRSPKMQSAMNLKVKFRESFRPFAPVVRRERVGDYFGLDCDSPYMLLVAPVKEALRTAAPSCASGSAGVPPANTRDTHAGETPALPGTDLIARVNEIRSTIPAVTHVDYSARIQTVTRKENARLHALLERWE